jgi:hypothetical protein
MDGFLAHCCLASTLQDDLRPTYLFRLLARCVLSWCPAPHLAVGQVEAVAHNRGWAAARNWTPLERDHTVLLNKMSKTELNAGRNRIKITSSDDTNSII